MMSKLGSEFGSVPGGKYDSAPTSTSVTTSDMNISLKEDQTISPETTQTTNPPKKGSIDFLYS